MTTDQEIPILKEEKTPNFPMDSSTTLMELQDPDKIDQNNQ
ncbi:5744_t:CDS:1, partial [Gigaspora margarita]